MKKLSLVTFFSFLLVLSYAQSPYGRVYTMLNTKCQNASCHSATSVGADSILKFDGDSNAVYQQIFNHPSQLSASSVAKFEELVFPQQPYQSFLLRKIAGANFDTDLSLDATGEGALMLDTSGQALSKIEIEWVRQWIRFGALKTYGSSDATPDYATVAQYYNDGQIIPFFAKPPKPAAGRGIQLRMGPVFLPTSGPFIEQEWLEQQVVNFPYLAQVTEIDGSMNSQSHHFLLFQYPDSASARSSSGSNKAPDVNDITQITPSTLGLFGPSSFDGNKHLTSAWQEDANMVLPTGTALMWDQKTYLDLNFHVKNYNATSVLPCDFYFNVYFEPRNNNTLPMISELVNNSLHLGESIVNQLSCYDSFVGPPYILPVGREWRQNYADGNNGGGGMRYLWMAAGHTHKFGTGYWIIAADTSGAMTDTIYNGQYDYVNNAPIGFWDHTHPPLEYWNNGLKPVYFGTNANGNIKGGLVANTSWRNDSVNCVHFGFTTADEMQLFYYMYTTQLPAADPNSVNNVATNPFLMTIQPNPVTGGGDGKIVYVLDNTSKVSSSIMDLSGKVISNMDEENEIAGAHTIAINSTQKLASGIYFARLIVDGSAYTKKFVVTN